MTSATDERDDTTAESVSMDAPAFDPDGGLLQATGVRKSFGGIVAVDGMDLAIQAGTMTGLIGPNGAGKSTMFNLITGVHTPEAGRIVFNGDDITGMRPSDIAARGLVRSFQIARELKRMTVMENVMLAAPNQSGESFWRAVTPGFRRKVSEEETELRERAWEVLDFFEIDHLAGEYAGNLSGGQRKLLEMARVLMTDPEMILLDEPLAGVNPTLEKKLLDRLHALQDEGHTFLVVEHDMEVIMNHCDPIIVMHQGSKLVEGDAETVRQDERVLEAYLGGEVRNE